MPLLTLYSRAHCHLCTEARRMLDAVAPRFGLTVSEVDVDGATALAERYGERIPVVALDGVEILAWPFTRVGALRALTEQMRGGSGKSSEGVAAARVPPPPSPPPSAGG